MRVEVLQARHPLGHKSVGDIIPEMPDGQAAYLAQRGIVKVITPLNRALQAQQRTAYVTKGKRR